MLEATSNSSILQQAKFNEFGGATAVSLTTPLPYFLQSRFKQQCGSASPRTKQIVSVLNFGLSNDSSNERHQSFKGLSSNSCTRNNEKKQQWSFNRQLALSWHDARWLRFLSEFENSRLFPGGELFGSVAQRRLLSYQREL